MPQAIWTGSISFGLVTVPVRLVSATKSQDVRFNQLEAETGSRIRYRRVSEQTGEEVPNDQIVKGYELENGHYVVLDNDELAALKPTASRMIEIEDFVDLSEIDPVYFEQPYYLVPDKDAAKAYRLLSRIMEDESKVAVGRFVLRSKESLVAIRPIDGMLCLETMRYADEVLAVDRELVDSQPEPSERELDMARQLVDTLSGDVRPREVPRRVPRGGARADRAEGRGGGDRRPGGARGAGQGARPHGRARGEPGPHRRQAARPRRHRHQAPREEGRGQEGAGEEPPKKSTAKKAAGAAKRTRKSA